MYFLGSRVDNVCIVLWEERKISLCAITFSYFSDWWVILYNLTSAQWMDLPQQSPSSYEYMSLTGCSNTLCKQFNCFVTENFFFANMSTEAVFYVSGFCFFFNILGWPTSSFIFSARWHGKTQMNFLANSIKTYF